MTTERLLEVIEEAKRRDDVVRCYAHALKVEHRASVDWAQVNAAIKERWSRSALIYIKKKAWAMYDVVLRGASEAAAMVASD